MGDCLRNSGVKKIFPTTARKSKVLKHWEIQLHKNKRKLLHSKKKKKQKKHHKQSLKDTITCIRDEGLILFFLRSLKN